MTSRLWHDHVGRRGAADTFFCLLELSGAETRQTASSVQKSIKESLSGGWLNLAACIFSFFFHLYTSCERPPNQIWLCLISSGCDVISDALVYFCVVCHFLFSKWMYLNTLNATWNFIDTFSRSVHASVQVVSSLIGRGRSYIGLNSDFILGVNHNTKLQEMDGLTGSEEQKKYK